MSRPLTVIWIALALGAGCSSIRTANDRTCAACGERIERKYVEVDGVSFHPDHFRCAYCKKPIEELTYISDGGKYYHKRCYAGHVIVCAYCNEPTEEDSFVTYKGKTYHSSCAREHVIKCAYCNKITGEETFVAQDGENYHRSCFREHIMACAFCGNPIREETYTSSNGKNYHTSCYEQFVVLRCTLCGERIEGDCITDYWGGTYHPSHRTDSPTCDFCGRFLRTPLEGAAVKYDDGRFLCGSCRASAVTTLERVGELAVEVSKRLRRFGIEVDADAITFKLIGAEEMRRLDPHSPHKLTGFTAYREVVGVPGRTDYEHIEVYVLYGMPRLQMTATIARELMRVWQLVHGRFKVNVKLAEGSCNYAAYLVLKENPGGKSEYLIHTMTVDDEKHYGRAFLRVKKYAQENGIASWLALLENNDPLPAY
jgi:hypothetical protein